ncbi:MAG TPA: M56 and DUF3738 domain-containing protein [Candidatus Angelobacter sp.]
MTANYFAKLWSSVAPALGNHLWQSTLFVVAVWLLTLLWRKNQARARYWLWLAASLKFLLPFSLLISLGSRLAVPRVPTDVNTGLYWAIEQVSQPFSQPTTLLHTQIRPAAISPNVTDLLPSILMTAWLCGLVVVLLVWRARWRRISAVMKETVPLQEGREVEALRRLENMTGMRRPMKMLSLPAFMEPGIFGIFRPLLLWPEKISERLDDEHLEAILAHELWHVRRRDNLAAAIHMVVEAIFWFHPLVWWLGARLIEERERACDQEVLALGSRRQIYAESILKTCEFCLEAPLPCISGVTGADLKKRIVHIMTQSLAEKLSLSRKVLLVTIGALAIAGPVVFGLLNTPHVRAQSPQTAATPLLSFDVASIKPNRSGENLTRLMMSPDGLTGEGVTLKMLIGFAYNMKDFQISGGPGWIDSERFDLNAKMDEATVKAMNNIPREQRQEQRRLMLQSLLAERFNLKVSHSTKELPIYALVVAKNGPKFSQSAAPSGSPGAPVQQRFMVQGGEVTLTAMPIKSLADWLSRVTGRNVVDKTGLQDNYDITLHWTSENGQQSPALTPVPRPADDNQGSAAPPPDSSGPSIFTALQEQLGLKLESQKGPVETLIIDSIDKPSGN